MTFGSSTYRRGPAAKDVAKIFSGKRNLHVEVAGTEQARQRNNGPRDCREIRQER